MNEIFWKPFSLDPPLELTGSVTANREAFYHVALSRVVRQTREENRTWQKILGISGETTATYIVQVEDLLEKDKTIGRVVIALEIVVNVGIFEYFNEILGEDFSYLYPYIVEHEIYEAWLSVKQGAAQRLKIETKHVLALRRQYYLAALDRLENKVFNFQFLVNPGNNGQYQAALAYARKRVPPEHP